jgi:hypothetical protein
MNRFENLQPAVYVCTQSSEVGHINTLALIFYIVLPLLLALMLALSITSEVGNMTAFSGYVEYK